MLHVSVFACKDSHDKHGSAVYIGSLRQDTLSETLDLLEEKGHKHSYDAKVRCLYVFKS